jgi:hypothetical protein
MMNMNNNMNMYENEDYMYPEVYQKFAPVADQLIRDMERQHGSHIYLNEDLLNQMTDEAIKRTNMDVPVSAMDAADDVVPVMYEFGRGRSRHGHGGGWRHYDRGALSDIYRILLLQSIFGRRRPFWRWR